MRRRPAIDPQKPAAFLIAHTRGSSFFSVRAEMRKATTNVNIRWNNKTYVIELVESDEPLLSVTFENAPDNSASVQAEPVTPSRLLALLDKAKAYPVLKAYHPEAVAQVDYRNYEKEPRILDCTNYAVKIEEVFRFNPEDTLIFRVGVTNKTDRELRYAPNGFFAACRRADLSAVHQRRQRRCAAARGSPGLFCRDRHTQRRAQ